MKNSTIILILATLIFFGSQTDLQAQDKYDFAVITHAVMQRPHLVISYSNQPGESVEFSKEELSSAKSLRDISLVLQYIAKMQDDGWEFMNAEGNSFYLRRKRP